METSTSTVDLYICRLCTRFLNDHSLIITCTTCDTKYHLLCCSIGVSDHSNWTCIYCTSALFPFNHLIDDCEFLFALGGESSTSFTYLGEGRKLELYNDENETRNLLNNPDLDPDANYFIHRPKESCYYTPTSLNQKLNLDQKSFTPRDPVSLMHINCRSIINKIPNLMILLDSLKIDILAVTETWLDEFSAEQIHIPGYNFISRQRSTGRGGGVGFFIKSHIIFHQMENCLSHQSYESLFIRLPLPNGSYFITGVIYRPPGQDIEQFNIDFNQLISSFTKKRNDTFILGDFNIDLLRAHDHLLTSSFFDILSTNHLLPTITKPTRITSTTSTLIDNILCSSISKLIDSFIIVTDISDHLPVMVRVDLNSCSQLPIHTQTRRIDETSITHFKAQLAQINWSSVHTFCSNNNPDIAYDEFFTLLKTEYDKSFPLIKKTTSYRNNFKHPWMTTGLLKSSRKKEKLYMKYIKNPTNENKQIFTIYRNKFKTLRIKAEKSYYENEFMNCSNDLRKTWRVIRSLINLNKSEKQVDSLTIAGINITDPDILAEKFNGYFTGLAQSLVEKLPPSNTSFDNYLNSPRPNSFAVIPATPNELIHICQSLKKTRSTGLDELDPFIMLSIIEEVAVPLTAIFNCSFSTGIVPSALKLAKIIPIFKQGDHEDITNYRPISILPYFSKVLEKLMYNRLYDYVTKMKILYPSQHGFQTGHSTSMALLTIQDNISTVIDKNEFAIGIFLDIAKAFDTVDHNILLAKLQNIGIRGINLCWFRNYLTNRQQLYSCVSGPLI